jgi:hypothetical protein
MLNISVFLNHNSIKIVKSLEKSIRKLGKFKLYTNMPPKKRKNQPVENDVDTDEEKSQASRSKISKKSSETNSIEIEKPKAFFSIFNNKKNETAAASASTKEFKHDLNWADHGDLTSKNIRPLVYLWSKILPGKQKVAAFDIDNTIIVTKSGKKFATSN